MRIKLINGAKMPEKKRQGDAGYDIYLNEDIVLKAGELTTISTGVCVEIPEGYAGILCVRSSSAKKNLLAQPILIDSNYRGQLFALVRNLNKEDISFKKGDRLVSLVVFPILDEALELTDNLSETSRGSNWNGSSGV